MLIGSWNRLCLCGDQKSAAHFRGELGDIGSITTEIMFFFLNLLP